MRPRIRPCVLYICVRVPVSTAERMFPRQNGRVGMRVRKAEMRWRNFEPLPRWWDEGLCWAGMVYLQ